VLAYKQEKTMKQEDLKKAMQQAQEMQVNLVRAQEELACMEVETISPDKMLRIVMSAQGDFKLIKLSPKLLEKPLSEIEKIILETLKESTTKAASLTKEKLALISKQIGL
jgi:DNA-binding protein YbaB